MPVYVYNWLVDFLSGHTHFTVYRGETSTLMSITASIIQGSGIGPASYVINASDLDVLTPGNELCKFADDTYLIIPAKNVESRSAEIDKCWDVGNQEQLDAKPKEVDRNRVCGHKKEASSCCISTNAWYSPRQVAQGLWRHHHQWSVGVRSRSWRRHYTARRLSMRWEFCALTAWMIRPCRSSSGRSSLPSYSMRAVLGRASPMRPTGSEYSLQLLSVWFASIRRAVPGCRPTTFLQHPTNCGHLLHGVLPPPIAASQNYNFHFRPLNRQLTPHSGHLTDSN